jgi:cytoskeleton protein RodZ
VPQQRRAKLSFGRRAAVAGPTAPKAGADLRSARERLAWPLETIAQHLRIRAQYLRALEDGDISALPGSAYALGFVRTYATALGLDPSETVRRFKTEALGVGERTPLEFPAPAPERGLPTGAIALLGIILAIGAYAGWYRLSGEGRLPAETVPAIPTRLASLAEQAIPPSAPRVVAPPVALNSSPYFAPNPVGAPIHVEAMAAIPAAASPGSAAAAPIVPAPIPTIAPAPALPAPDQPRLILRATADAWIQVRERNGAMLLSRTLKPGEIWNVPAKPNLLMTTGNAAGTEVVFDGVAVASLGASGAVRRDLMLDPDQIKDGRLIQAAVTPVAAQRASQ